MINLTSYRKIFFYYLLVLVGLLLLWLMFYIRFLRYRIPKNIPLMLTEFWFYLLIIICFSYLFIIKQLLYPKIPPKGVLTLAGYLSLPLVTLDNYVKNHSKIKTHYDRLMNYIIVQISNFSTVERRALIFLFQLIPGFLLALIFLTDIFYTKKLEIFYYFLFLGVFPLFYAYYKYSMELLKKQYFSYLNDRYDRVKILDQDVEDLPTAEINPAAIYYKKVVSVERYFEIKLECFFDEDSDIDYYASPYSKNNCIENYRIKHNKVDKILTMEDYKILAMDFHNIEPKLFELMLYLDATKNTSALPFIKISRIVLYSLYLFGWIYLLVKSLHTLNNIPITLDILQFLTHYTRNINPFSDP